MEIDFTGITKEPNLFISVGHCNARYQKHRNLVEILCNLVVS